MKSNKYKYELDQEVVYYDNYKLPHLGHIFAQHTDEQGNFYTVKEFNDDKVDFSEQYLGHCQKMLEESAAFKVGQSIQMASVTSTTDSDYIRWRFYTVLSITIVENEVEGTLICYTLKDNWTNTNVHILEKRLIDFSNLYNALKKVKE